MGEVIVVTSGKGGVGKTTTVANLGSALALLNQKVAVIDTDIGLRNLDVLMGLDDCVVYDIIDVVKETCTLEQGLIQDNQLTNLFLLSASQTKEKSDLTPEEMATLAQTLAEKFDFVLVDCPAGIEEGFQNAIAGAQQGIVVITPDFPSLRDADRVIDFLTANGIEQIQLLINRYRPNLVTSGSQYPISEIEEMLGYDVLAIVPEDDEALISASQGKPVVHQQEAKSGQAYRNAARRLLGESVPFLSLEEPAGFWTRLKKVFCK